MSRGLRYISRALYKDCDRKKLNVLGLGPIQVCYNLDEVRYGYSLVRSFPITAPCRVTNTFILIGVSITSLFTDSAIRVKFSCYLSVFKSRGNLYTGRYCVRVIKRKFISKKNQYSCYGNKTFQYKYEDIIFHLFLEFIITFDCNTYLVSY